MGKLKFRLPQKAQNYLMVEPGKEHRFAKALYHAGTLWFSYSSSLHFCSP